MGKKFFVLSMVFIVLAIGLHFVGLGILSRQHHVFTSALSDPVHKEELKKEAESLLHIAMTLAGYGFVSFFLSIFMTILSRLWEEPVRYGVIGILIIVYLGMNLIVF